MHSPPPALLRALLYTFLMVCFDKSDRLQRERVCVWGNVLVHVYASYLQQDGPPRDREL